jgi:prepilin-type N-terminal cleavage/methylation domain-containing protein
MRNSTQRNVARPARTGFTVTELVVVVAIIGLIVALLVPTIGKVRSKSRTLKCLTNQRTITMANYTYATSNQSRFASPRTDSFGILNVNGSNVNNGSTHCWVKAEGANLAPGGQFERPSAIEQGSLYSYIGDIKSYISPDEPTNPLASNISSTGTRVRSYSFNALLGSTRPDELPEFDDDFTANMYGVAPQLSQYNSTTIGTIKSPQRMMATIVEDDSVAYNNEGWLVLPQMANWIDWPAGWRPDAITMSYVDGSTDSYELANPDLPNKWDSNGHRWPQPNETTVDESGQTTGSIVPPDWKFFRDRLNPGVIPNSTYLFGN